MELKTKLFGTVQVGDKELITFADGLPGFEELHDFVMIVPEQTKPFCWLQSTEKDIALPLIDPFIVDQDYSPFIEDAQVEQLNIEAVDDLIVMAVAVIPEDVTAMTANLMAPILINSLTGAAIQAICDNDSYQVRQKIFEAVESHLNGGDQ